MKSINDLTFQNVYGSNEIKLKQEIVDFWKRNDVLDEITREQRANEVVYLVRNYESQIIGVSSVAKVIHEPLDSYIYLYRFFVEKPNRALGLDTKLTVKTRDFLESIYKIEIPTAIGLLIVAQADYLKQWNKAVWPGTNLTFIGNTASGDPIRIFYFKGAKIG